MKKFELHGDAMRRMKDALDAHAATHRMRMNGGEVVVPDNEYADSARRMCREMSSCLQQINPDNPANGADYAGSVQTMSRETQRGADAIRKAVCGTGVAADPKGEGVLRRAMGVPAEGGAL